MDVTKTGNILVPQDFSEVANNAMNYANQFAKIFDKRISLLHVVEKQGMFSGNVSSTDKVYKEAESKLREVADANTASSGVETEALLRPGNIFDEIGETADGNNCTMIIMGTHGIRGMQALTGSRALKVITNSKTPFIVVQKKEWNPDGMKRIVVPVDDEPETKQKMHGAMFMAKIFDATLYILSQENSDEFVNNKIKNNVAWCRNNAKHEGIPSEHILLDIKEDRTKGTISRSTEIGADLVVIDTDPDTNIADYVLGPFEQKIIANDAQIPVMCINTKQIYSVGGNVFSYSA